MATWICSSAYATRSKITNLQQAIAYLGMRQVRNLAVTASVSRLFKQKESIGSYQRNGLWRHLVAVGICGRLLCCLTYEDVIYREASKRMPRMGRRIQTPDGAGRIKDRDVLRGVVRVQLDDENGLREFRIDELGDRLSQTPPPADSPSPERDGPGRRQDRSNRSR